MKKIEESATYDIHARFWGDDFKPSKLVKISELPLSNISEPGEICKIGRYKGEINKHGGASLLIPQNVESKGFYEKLEWVISSLEQNQKFIVETGVNEITIHLVIGYEDQCSLALDPTYLKRISNLNAGITFDAYKFEDVDPDNPKNELAELVIEFKESISEVAKMDKNAAKNIQEIAYNTFLQVANMYKNTTKSISNNKLEGSVRRKPKLVK